MLYLRSHGSFPGCQVYRRTDGAFLINRTQLWPAMHSEKSQSKPSSYVKELGMRLPLVHKLLYPGDDASVGTFKPMFEDDIQMESCSKVMVIGGEGMHMHLVMAFFWWGFSGHRCNLKERTRWWENRLAAAMSFRDFVNSILSHLPNEITFHIDWGGGARRPCKLVHGMLHLQPCGGWRELPALELLGHRWLMHSQSCGDGLHWLTGSPYHASVSDLLVGGAMLSSPSKHEDLFLLLQDVLGQLGNLLNAVMPLAVTEDATVMRVNPRHHFDKGLLAAWVDEVLKKTRFTSLPALLRSMQIAGVSQACQRIYKAWFATHNK